MAKGQSRRSSGDMLPGEARRQGLVTVERVSFLPGASDSTGREVHSYIVRTRRMDGAWSHQVEYRGQNWEMPGRVYEMMERQRASIVKQQRKEKAREVHQRLAAQSQERVNQIGEN